jgi:hypothetical protein
MLRIEGQAAVPRHGRLQTGDEHARKMRASVSKASVALRMCGSELNETAAQLLPQSPRS